MLITAVFVLALSSTSVLTDSCSLAKNELNPVEGQLQRLYGPEFSNWNPAICEKLLEEFSDISFSIIGHTSTRDIKPQAKGKLSISALKAGRIKLIWDAGENGKQTYWLKVSAKQEAWVFKRKLKRHSLIHKRDVKRMRVDVANTVGINEIFLSSPVGKIVAKEVRRGDLITQNLVKTPPLVSRKEEITITARAGSLSITSKGIALGTAWKVGEILQVKINGATEPVRAVVTGVKQANVEI